MSSDPFAFIEEAIDEALRRWNLAAEVRGQELAARIKDGVSYYERGLPDGTYLSIVRLFVPIVRREEVFLGSVLLNDYLSKAVIRAVEQHALGRIELLANDLESYYFLYHRLAPLEMLAAHVQYEVLEHLKDLYFGDEDPGSGIYGAWQRMFTFTRSQYEPFPVYAVPAFLARHLELAIRRQLETLLSGDSLKQHLGTIKSALAFFYGQTSGSTGDAQSPPLFLFRLIEQYHLLTRKQVGDALGLKEDEVSKERIRLALLALEDKNGRDITTEVTAGLRALFGGLLATFGKDIDQGGETWLLGFIRAGRKLIEAPQERFFSAIAAQVTLGYLALSEGPTTRATIGCRLCGKGVPIVLQKYVVSGLGAFRFHTKNPQLGKEAPALCIKCALAAYLQMRVLGAEEVNAGGNLRQVPQRYTLAFHYGPHDDQDARQFAYKIDEIFKLIAFLEQQTRKEDYPFSVDAVRELVALRAASRAAAGVQLSMAQFWEDVGADDVAQSALDVLGHISAEARVLPLGRGRFRLLAFVFPQLQRRGKKNEDMVQERFSQSRLAAYTMLALLRKLCGCDGPYYFQSVPQLRPGEFDPHSFYVRGQRIGVDRVLTHYGAIINFARRIAKPRKRSRSVDWILLAERIEAAPFEMCSEILRRTPMQRRDFRPGIPDTFGYQPLAGPDTIDGTGITDGRAYLKLLDQVRRTIVYARTGSAKRGETMARQVDTQPLAEFCLVLFRALDAIGGVGTDFLPLFLDTSPNAYERYSRLLLSSIRIHDDVEAGYEEWSTKILRDANAQRREERFPALLSVKRWLVEHRELFEQRRDNLTHLKRSLLCLVYEYLYPRRRLVLYYTRASRGNKAALEEEAIRERFESVVADERAKLAEVYGEGEQLQAILDDALQFLIANRRGLRWKEEKEPPGTSSTNGA